MTEPIREKFEGLDDNLQARHNALMDKLDEVIVAMTEPVDYSAAFASLGGKLDAILNALVDPFEGGSPVLSQLAAMRNDFSYLASRVDLVGTSVGVTNGWLDSIMDTLGVKAPGAEFTLASLSRAQSLALQNIYARLEGIDAPWPANVLAALECICEASSALVPIDPLDETQQPAGCVAHYQSDGQNIIPFSLIGGTSINIASFSVLPDGMSYGSTFGLADDTSELFSPDWSEWAVFVKSDAAQYSDGYGLLGVERYPTNQWRVLDGPGSRAFSVDARNGIEVHFCKLNPYVIAEGECQDFADNSEFQDQRAFTIPAGIPDTYTLSASDNFYRWAPPDDYIGGPINAGFPMTIGDLRAGGASILQFGSSPFDPPVVVTICNPLPA